MAHLCGEHMGQKSKDPTTWTDSTPSSSKTEDAALSTATLSLKDWIFFAFEALGCLMPEGPCWWSCPFLPRALVPVTERALDLRAACLGSQDEGEEVERAGRCGVLAAPPDALPPGPRADPPPNAIATHEETESERGISSSSFFAHTDDEKARR